MGSFNDCKAPAGATPGGDRVRISGASLLIPPKLVFLVGLVTMLASVPYAATVEVEARVVKVIDGCRDLNKNGTVDPYENWRLPVEKRVEDLLSRMTMEEKIGQMAYPVNAQNDDGSIPLKTKAEVDNGAGFVFYIAKAFPSTRACAEGSNLIQIWAENTRLGIPAIIGMDPHPHIYHGTKIVGGVSSMALSATNNLETVRKVYQVWGKEMRASGIHMTLGPQTDLTTDPRGVRNLDTPGRREKMPSGFTR